MKGVVGAAAVGPGIGQARDDVEELHDRTGPAVDEQQREGVFTGGAGVYEVDRLTLDARPEMGQLVEARLLRSPVVPVLPVLQ